MLKNQTAVLLTARTAYSKALQQALPMFVGDTMRFNWDVVQNSCVGGPILHPAALAVTLRSNATRQSQ